MKTLNSRALVVALVLFGATAAHAQVTATWRNGTGDGFWNTPGNWSTGLVPGPTDTAAFTNTGGVVTITGANASVAALTKRRAVGVTINGPGTLTIGAGGIARTGGNPLNVLTIAANIILAAAQTWQIGGNGITTTFSGAVSQPPTGGSFIKTGVGILLLSGNNTFAGATLNAGTLEATTATALGSGTITLAGGTLNISSGIALSLPIAVTTSGNSTLNVQGGAVTHSVASVTDNAGNTLALTNANGASLSVGTFDVNGTVNGGPTLTVTGTLTGNGTLNSAVTVAAGATLNPLAGAPGLRTGALTMNNTTQYKVTVGATAPHVTVNGGLVLDGILTVTAGAGLAAGTFALMNATGAVTDNHLQIPSATVPAGFNIGTAVAGQQVNLIVSVRALGLNAANLQATFDARHTQVAWTMRQEQKALGYRLWKETGAGRVRVGPGLVPGGAVRMGTDLKNGPSYILEDWTPSPGGTYWVEAVGMDGVSSWLGPVLAQAGPTRATSTVATDPSRTPLPLSHAPPSAQLAAKTVTPVPASPPSAAWNLAASVAAKVTVSEPGIYRISAEALFTAGIPVRVPLASLSVSSLGSPVAFRALSADGTHLDVGDALDFYGESFDARYTGVRVYWVTAALGSGPQLGMSTSSAGPSAGPSFLETLGFQDRLNYFGGLKNGGQQKFFGPWVDSLPEVRSYTLPALDLTSSEGSTLEVALQGVTLGQHVTQVSINGVAIGTMEGTGRLSMTKVFQIPSGLLTAGQNTVQLLALGNGDASFETYQRLNYPRLYDAMGSPLYFTAPGGTTVHLAGSATGTSVVDITDPRAPAIVDAAPEPDNAAVLVVNVPAGGQRFLYAYSNGDVKLPLSVQPNTPSTVHSTPAELVVIAHASLLASMAPLVAQRAADGLRVALVDVEDVYDEFSHGEKDAQAIHDFLAYASTNWNPRPRYVLLVGSASYNPRNYGLDAGVNGGVDLVPTPLVETEYMETGSDDAFAAYSSTSPPTLALGRLPLSDATGVAQAVAKILARPLVNESSQLLFVQDADDPVSNFTQQTTEVRNGLWPWQASTLSRSDAFAEGSPQEAAADTALHASLLAALRGAPAMVNYLGHGAQDSWSGSILSGEDVGALSSSPAASVFFTGSCLNGYFVDEGNEFLAGALLSAPTGGAWAMVASSGSTNPGEQATLAVNLWRAAFFDGLPLGDALQLAKGAILDPDVRATFELFGDPSARMAPAKSAALGTPPQVNASGATGCGTPGLPVLSVLPLVLIALLRSVRARRSLAVPPHGAPAGARSERRRA